MPTIYSEGYSAIWEMWVKMPDAAQGNHPLNADLVEDALDKAFRAGVQYCFTWNVRQFVLFDSHIQGVPFAQRHIEGPTNVVEASVSDDVRPDRLRVSRGKGASVSRRSGEPVSFGKPGFPKPRCRGCLLGAGLSSERRCTLPARPPI